MANFDGFVATLSALVDGLWAADTGDVAAVVGPATYQLAAKTFQSNTNYKGELAASNYLKREFGGFWTNSRMPAKKASNHVQQAVAYRMGQPGIRKAVCPHWGELSVDDIYTGSDKAERYLTVHVLLGDVLLVQPGAFSQVAFKLA